MYKGQPIPPPPEDIEPDGGLKLGAGPRRSNWVLHAEPGLHWCSRARYLRGPSLSRAVQHFDER